MSKHSYEGVERSGRPLGPSDDYQGDGGWDAWETELSDFEEGFRRGRADGFIVGALTTSSCVCVLLLILRFFL